MKKKAILIIVAFTVLLCSEFMHGAIPASERAALMALYNSTNGDNWPFKTGWKTAPLHTDGFGMPGTEGSWAGVTVTGDHVTKIRMMCHKLIGTIPPELGNLSYLEELRMNNSEDYIEEIWNHLSGAIPSELGNLSQLKYLYLDHNGLSGVIPVEFGSLTKLKKLNLASNQLTGSIPAQLGDLSNLEILALYSNRLSGSIPSELGNLVQLRELFLGNNRLSGIIPSSFLNLTHITTLEVIYNCLSTTDPALIVLLDKTNPEWKMHQDLCSIPKIALNRTQLNFGEYDSTIALPPQTVIISNSGGGTLNWSVSSDVSWLAFMPYSGTGNTTLQVLANSYGLSAGVYTGIIEITDPDASNSPQTITVTMHVYEKGKTSAPFGEFTTPLQGSSVYNSIPLTGWALDDIGVGSVNIYNGDTLIGYADFVEGARPDFETVFPTYPRNYKAGWGYMLLTNFLPNGGNGTYTLTAKALDYDGNEVTLGSKTITIDNAHAVKPFGTIDTPTQGGTASGKNFVNYGWALTPQPNSIPFYGSTINVVIDGVVKGHPEYNVFRSDIANLFPGYANTNGAVGYYYLDTTQLANGVHAIAWTVTDNAGNSDGIGSRYFSVMNTETNGASSILSGMRVSQYEKPPDGFLCLEPTEELYFEIKELERVEINLFAAEVFEGYFVVGDQLRELPIGSTIDKSGSIFYWQPGPGFVGTYRFVFISKDDKGQYTRKNIVINIKPRH